MEEPEQLKKLESDPLVRNLNDQAFMDAGECRGNSSVYKHNLNLIFSGALLDKSTFVSLTQDEIQIVEGKIQFLELKRVNIQQEIDSCKLQIKSNEKKIDELTDKLNNYSTGNITKNNIGATIELFNRSKFIIASFFLIMLSIFIFLFYVAVVYKAIIMNDSEIAKQFATGNFGVNVLPHGSEVSKAIASNMMVIFAPFVFFGFGYALHNLLELSNKVKYIYIGLIIFITLALDYFLADRIHQKMNNALQIMGQQPNSKFSDILIVLILGFVVYIIWSVIFHSWAIELEKLNIPSNISRIIRKLKKENKGHEIILNKLNGEISSIELEIRQNKNKLDHRYVSLNTIIKSLSIYTQGWFRFLSGLHLELKQSLINECENVLNTFKNEKGISGHKIISEKL